MIEYQPMQLRVLTLREPWAFAVFHLGKNIENRGWATEHRGPLGIHSASRHRDKAAESLLITDELRAVYERHLTWGQGKLLGVVELLDCIRNPDQLKLDGAVVPNIWAQPDCVHWQLVNPEGLRVPIRCSGQLRLFTLELMDDDLRRTSACGCLFPD